MALGALVLVLAAACGPNGAVQAPSTTPGAAQTSDAPPSLADIASCALAFVKPRFADDLAGFQRASQILDRADAAKDLTAAALAVYGRPSIRDLTIVEQDELILIATGLDACGNVSDPLKQSAVGVIDLLRTFVQPGTGDGGEGPALCPGTDPFGPPSSYRFEPDCPTPASTPSPTPRATPTVERPAGAVPDGFLGLWNGGIEQSRPPIPPFSLTVTIRQGAVGSTIATGSYTGTSPCAVHWTLLSAADDRLVVDEKVDSGDCFDDIEVTLTATGDGTLDYDFENGNGRGKLTRTST